MNTHEPTFGLTCSSTCQKQQGNLCSPTQQQSSRVTFHEILGIRCALSSPLASLNSCPTIVLTNGESQQVPLGMEISCYKRNKPRETLPLGYCGVNLRKRRERGLRSRSQQVRKRKEKGRNLRLESHRTAPEAPGPRSSVSLGQPNPRVNHPLPRCDWPRASLASLAPTSQLLGVYFPKVHGPHLVEQPLLH